MATRTPAALPRNVRLLDLAGLLNDIASEMIYPLLPQFLRAVLDGNRVHLGVIEGMADSTASLLKLLSGGHSDRAGRRKGFVVFGHALATLARPLIGLATAPWHVFAARTGDRVGKGVRTSPRDARIADSTESGMRGRAFGFHRAMDHLGAAIGRLLALALLLAWPGQVRALFLLTLLPGLGHLKCGILATGLQFAREVTGQVGLRRHTARVRGWNRVGLLLSRMVRRYGCLTSLLLPRPANGQGSTEIIPPDAGGRSRRSVGLVAAPLECRQGRRFSRTSLS